MDGWVCGRVDGWMDGWMDGWVGGWMDGILLYDHLLTHVHKNMKVKVNFKL
jgi:hypothetical protein